MAGGPQLRIELRRKAILYLQAGGGLAPSTAEQPARPGYRFLQIDAKPGIAREYRRLGLRLSFAPHRAISHHPPIRETRHGRIQGMKWLSSRPQRVPAICSETEAAASILPCNTGLGQNETGSEFEIGTLYRADDTAIRIGGRKP